MKFATQVLLGTVMLLGLSTAATSVQAYQEKSALESSLSLAQSIVSRTRYDGIIYDIYSNGMVVDEDGNVICLSGG